MEAMVQTKPLLLLVFPALFFLMLSFAAAAASSSSDGYLIDCGSVVDTFFENRTYSADLNASSVSVSAPSSFFATDEISGGKDKPELYRTARVFSDLSSYQFHELKNGTYFLRLHFSPFQHPDYERYHSFSSENYDLAAVDFHVMVAQVPVFNYSPFPGTVLIKEFIVHANPNSTLTISFKPSSNSHAFVSAIEVVYAPTGLLPDSVNHELKLSEYILETVHRVNVGGPEIAPTSDHLFRNWTSDNDGSLLLWNSTTLVNYPGSLSYLAGLSTRETAPTGVYTSGRKPANLNTWSQHFNMTWILDRILPDTHYMIRLHFCDIISESFSDLDFNIYINLLLAKDSFQPGSMTNQRPHTPLYVDFVAKTNPGDDTIRISISPVEISSQKAILNGVEILRMVSTGSSKTHIPLKKRTILIASVTCGSVLVLLALAAAFILLRKRRKVLQKDEKIVMGSKKDGVEGTSVYSYGGATLTYGSPSLHQNYGLIISFEDIRLATDNFNEASIIGHGGFGKVYSGVLKDGTRVAVKRANPNSQQGLKEFQAEIMVLSDIRHKHLVSLIGYCAEESEMILVYEFMELGPLQKHLYGSSDLPTLSWTQRLEICIGAARGLHYLHTGSTQSVIHRDVKSSNILLDEDYTAKVADFGLSKLGPTYSQTHVSTTVKGSFGYMDPEYFKRHQLTEKSDVYSFGVVLLETLSAMRTVDNGRPNGEQSIVEWGLRLHKKGQMDKLVDPRIKEEVHPNALRNYLETTVKCLAEDGVGRPAMGEVLWSLEYVLRLQQTALGRREPHEDSNPAVASFGNGVPRMPSISVGDGGVEGGDCSDSESGLSSSRIFSQLITDHGR